eukprot:4690620-Ditylum_brightwellii.AAC.1
MEEKDGEEGVGRKISEDMHDEENNIHDKEEEEDDNGKITMDENNGDQNNTISVSTSSSTHPIQKLHAKSK